MFCLTVSKFSNEFMSFSNPSSEVTSTRTICSFSDLVEISQEFVNVLQTETHGKLQNKQIILTPSRILCTLIVPLIFASLSNADRLM